MFVNQAFANDEETETFVGKSGNRNPRTGQRRSAKGTPPAAEDRPTLAQLATLAPNEAPLSHDPYYASLKDTSGPVLYRQGNPEDAMNTNSALTEVTRQQPQPRSGSGPPTPRSRSGAYQNEAADRVTSYPQSDNSAGTPSSGRRVPDSRSDQKRNRTEHTVEIHPRAVSPMVNNNNTYAQPRGGDVNPQGMTSQKPVPPWQEFGLAAETVLHIQHPERQTSPSSRRGSNVSLGRGSVVSLGMDATSMTMHPHIGKKRRKKIIKKKIEENRWFRGLSNFLQDNRIENGDPEVIAKYQAINRKEIDNFPKMSKVLNIFFIIAGILLLLAVIVLIIYTDPLFNQSVKALTVFVAGRSRGLW